MCNSQCFEASASNCGMPLCAEVKSSHFFDHGATSRTPVHSERCTSSTTVLEDAAAITIWQSLACQATEELSSHKRPLSNKTNNAHPLRTLIVTAIPLWLRQHTVCMCVSQRSRRSRDCNSTHTHTHAYTHTQTQSPELYICICLCLLECIYSQG